MTVTLPFDNTYARLDGPFFTRTQPTAVSAPRLVKLNRELALQLGLGPDALSSPDGVSALAGRSLFGGSEPIATAYAGHQFGHFSPQLGDGRALLIGEVLDRSGARRDIQLKGSGPTPFSRGGDGRAALGPVLREYLVSEAMAALGVPTTRALAAVTTGEHVMREEILPGAVLARVASSHIRIGTFEFFAARRDVASLKTMADYAIARHDPAAAQAENPYRALFEGVVRRQAELLSRWMLLGFIHGVMNTDNMSISGETIDYGPCAFMDTYDPATVFSSIDRQGRYAYGAQPGIAQWNLARLAEALLPLMGEDQKQAVAQAQAALDVFVEVFNDRYLSGLRRKLGLVTAREEDLALAQALLARMASDKVDFTLLFRRLADAAADLSGNERVRDLFMDLPAIDEWLARWRARLAQEPASPEDRADAMRRANPAFIPRNHLVERMIEAAVERQDYAPFEEFLRVLAHPYEDQPEFAAYAEAPPPSSQAYVTYCGT
ncbi:YdiU family protein [Alsobacter soli]|uniref:Protein nucleotidyltransferase YdiU n=1 Tax=Alsobacter soli TaxID=2109933 RepID=A0A2T1HU28_9HYPH|nr:YdiU family protein [Alsobacter soli]PSC05128.1 YdiU family protein [Alsobacter soli]